MTLTIEEAAAVLGISRALAYELVKRGELPSLRLGRRVVVLRKALEAFVEAVTRTSASPAGRRLMRTNREKMPAVAPS
jgi:excisionase family DNA binding protein